MTIPRENALAFFPRTVKAGGVTLLPLTLAGAVRLAGVGVDLGRRVPQGQLYEAAFVLAHGGDPTEERVAYARFVKGVKCGLNALSSAVESALDGAFATYLKPANEGRTGAVRLTPHGLGWPLEYAEYLCAEYGWSWCEAINTEVVTAFALAAAYRQRNGGKCGGYDYIERAYAEELKSRRAARNG